MVQPPPVRRNDDRREMRYRGGTSRHDTGLPQVQAMHYYHNRNFQRQLSNQTPTATSVSWKRGSIELGDDGSVPEQHQGGGWAPPSPRKQKNRPIVSKQSSVLFEEKDDSDRSSFCYKGLVFDQHNRMGDGKSEATTVVVANKSKRGLGKNMKAFVQKMADKVLPRRNRSSSHKHTKKAATTRSSSSSSFSVLHTPPRAFTHSSTPTTWHSPDVNQGDTMNDDASFSVRALPNDCGATSPLRRGDLFDMYDGTSENGNEMQQLQQQQQRVAMKPYQNTKKEDAVERTMEQNVSPRGPSFVKSTTSSYPVDLDETLSSDTSQYKEVGPVDLDITPPMDSLLLGEEKEEERGGSTMDRMILSCQERGDEPHRLDTSSTASGEELMGLRTLPDFSFSDDDDNDNEDNNDNGNMIENATNYGDDVADITIASTYDTSLLLPQYEARFRSAVTPKRGSARQRRDDNSQDGSNFRISNASILQDTDAFTVQEQFETQLQQTSKHHDTSLFVTDAVSTTTEGRGRQLQKMSSRNAVRPEHLKRMVTYSTQIQKGRSNWAKSLATSRGASFSQPHEENDMQPGSTGEQCYRHIGPVDLDDTVETTRSGGLVIKSKSHKVSGPVDLDDTVETTSSGGLVIKSKDGAGKSSELDNGAAPPKISCIISSEEPALGTDSARPGNKRTRLAGPVDLDDTIETLEHNSFVQTNEKEDMKSSTYPAPSLQAVGAPSQSLFLNRIADFEDDSLLGCDELSVEKEGSMGCLEPYRHSSGSSTKAEELLNSFRDDLTQFQDFGPSFFRKQDQQQNTGRYCEPIDKDLDDTMAWSKNASFVFRRARTTRAAKPEANDNTKPPLAPGRSPNIVLLKHTIRPNPSTDTRKDLVESYSVQTSRPSGTTKGKELKRRPYVEKKLETRDGAPAGDGKGRKLIKTGTPVSIGDFAAWPEVDLEAAFSTTNSFPWAQRDNTLARPDLDDVSPVCPFASERVSLDASCSGSKDVSLDTANISCYQEEFQIERLDLDAAVAQATSIMKAKEHLQRIKSKPKSMPQRSREPPTSSNHVTLGELAPFREDTHPSDSKKLYDGPIDLHDAVDTAGLEMCDVRLQKNHCTAENRDPEDLSFAPEWKPSFSDETSSQGSAASSAPSFFVHKQESSYAEKVLDHSLTNKVIPLKIPEDVDDSGINVTGFDEQIVPAESRSGPKSLDGESAMESWAPSVCSMSINDEACLSVSSLVDSSLVLDDMDETLISTARQEIASEPVASKKNAPEPFFVSQVALLSARDPTGQQLSPRSILSSSKLQQNKVLAPDDQRADEQYRTECLLEERSAAELQLRLPGAVQPIGDDAVGAATLIQAHWRSYFCRVCYLQFLSDIVLIQSLVRQWIARCRVADAKNCANFWASIPLASQSSDGRKVNHALPNMPGNLKSPTDLSSAQNADLRQDPCTLFSPKLKVEWTAQDILDDINSEKPVCLTDNENKKAFESMREIPSFHSSAQPDPDQQCHSINTLKPKDNGKCASTELMSTKVMSDSFERASCYGDDLVLTVRNVEDTCRDHNISGECTAFEIQQFKKLFSDQSSEMNHDKSQTTDEDSVTSSFVGDVAAAQDNYANVMEEIRYCFDLSKRQASDLPCGAVGQNSGPKANGTEQIKQEIREGLQAADKAWEEKNLDKLAGEIEKLRAAAVVLSLECREHRTEEVAKSNLGIGTITSDESVCKSMSEHGSSSSETVSTLTDDKLNVSLSSINQHRSACETKGEHLLDGNDTPQTKGSSSIDNVSHYSYKDPIKILVEEIQGQCSVHDLTPSTASSTPKTTNKGLRDKPTDEPSKVSPPILGAFSGPSLHKQRLSFSQFQAKSRVMDQIRRLGDWKESRPHKFSHRSENCQEVGYQNCSSSSKSSLVCLESCTQSLEGKKIGSKISSECPVETGLYSSVVDFSKVTSHETPILVEDEKDLFVADFSHFNPMENPTANVLSTPCASTDLKVENWQDGPIDRGNETVVRAPSKKRSQTASWNNCVPDTVDFTAEAESVVNQRIEADEEMVRYLMNGMMAPSPNLHDFSENAPQSNVVPNFYSDNTQNSGSHVKELFSADEKQVEPILDQSIDYRENSPRSHSRDEYFDQLVDSLLKRAEDSTSQELQKSSKSAQDATLELRKSCESEEAHQKSVVVTSRSIANSIVVETVEYDDDEFSFVKEEGSDEMTTLSTTKPLEVNPNARKTHKWDFSNFALEESILPSPEEQKSYRRQDGFSSGKSDTIQEAFWAFRDLVAGNWYDLSPSDVKREISEIENSDEEDAEHGRIADASSVEYTLDNFFTMRNAAGQEDVSQNKSSGIAKQSQQTPSPRKMMSPVGRSPSGVTEIDSRAADGASGIPNSERVRTEEVVTSKLVSREAVGELSQEHNSYILPCNDSRDRMKRKIKARNAGVIPAHKRLDTY